VRHRWYSGSGECKYPIPHGIPFWIKEDPKMKLMEFILEQDKYQKS
jgi:hypothetical protein